MPEYRILVCGGRDYGYVKGFKELYAPEIHFLYEVLSAKLITTPFVLVQGAAKGADSSEIFRKYYV